MRVGYVPINSSLEGPGDRRRFVYYAKKRNIRFEIARPAESYDVLVLTQAADISLWSKHPRGGAKIIFDLVDSYFSVPRLNLRGMLRGTAKFLARQNRRLRVDYRRALEDMCRRADATICASEEQKQQILPFCPNVHVILDSHGEFAGISKRDYSAQDGVHLIWEGLGVNARHLWEIKPALQSFSRKRPFHLHVVTQLEYGQFLGGRFGKRTVLDDLRGLSPHISFYAWNAHSFPAIVTSCDLALIPIPLHDPMLAAKSENRLLLFWQLGMPVLVSATPAHVRTMRQCGLNMALTAAEEWEQALEYYSSNEAARRQSAQIGRTFAERHHNPEKILEQWDDVFRSL